MPVVLGLLALPIVEIALFIVAGGLIGLWPVLLIVVLSGLAGAALIREAGFGGLGAVRSSLMDDPDPARPLFDRAAMFVAGGLMMVPGLLTTALGLILLLPPVKGLLYARLRRNLTVRRYRDPAGEVIDGEYRPVAEEPPGLPDRRH